MEKYEEILVVVYLLAVGVFFATGHYKWAILTGYLVIVVLLHQIVERL